MNKLRRGDYGNNPLAEQPKLGTGPQSPPSVSIEGLRPGYQCPSKEATKYPRPFKAGALKCQPAKEKIP